MGATARHRRGELTGSDQKNCGTETEKIANRVRWRSRRRKQGKELNLERWEILNRENCRLVGGIPTDDDELSVAPESVAARELHNMVWIGFARRLREQGQRLGYGPVVMFGTFSFVMQHEPHSACAWLKERVMIGINCSERRHRTHSERRKYTHVQQQRAPSCQKAEDVVACSMQRFHLSRLHSQFSDHGKRPGLSPK